MVKLYTTGGVPHTPGGLPHTTGGLPHTTGIKHGVHMSIEPARSHHALKHPSIICIPYVMGGGWELFIRIRMVTAPAADIVTLPYLTIQYLTLN